MCSLMAAVDHAVTFIKVDIRSRRGHLGIQGYDGGIVRWVDPAKGGSGPHEDQQGRRPVSDRCALRQLSADALFIRPERQMTLAETIMREDRDVPRALAK